MSQRTTPGTNSITEQDAWGPNGHPSRAGQWVLSEVAAELRRATAKFGPMASPHEAYAVILEELDEFWLAVKVKGISREDARAELIQTAAMAIRAVIDCYGDLEPPR